MKHILLTGICIICIALPVGAQELAPEEPDMVLPPMSLELEALLQEDVDTILPEQEYAPELELETGLPELPEMEFPLTLTEVDLDLESDTAEREVPVEKTGSFYSTGKIGLGNTNRILGDLTIYKLGAEPHIQMHFIHERYDGYHFRERGSGFFHRYNLISGGISFRPESFLLDINAGFEENNDGLQGLGPYNSVLHRSIGGDFSYRYYADEVVSLGADFAGLYTQETLSGEIPLNGQEIALDPKIVTGFHIDPVTISFETMYSFRFITGGIDPLHRIGGKLGLDVTLKNDWNFGGSVGADWHTQKKVQVPFALYFRKGIDEILDIILRGGYETTLLRYGDLWLDAPFYRLSALYPEESRWFAYSHLEWNIVPYLTLSGKVDFSLFERSVYPIETLDPLSGMLLLQSRNAYLLDTEVRIRWETLEWLSLQAYWGGNFLDVPPFLPAHTAGMSVVLSTKDNVWSGEVDIEVPVPGALEMPLLGCSVTFAPSTGVDFSLRGEDLLSPLMSENRKEWGYYETPGLNVMFTASISL